MPCKNCKHFRKLRNISFGDCSNDELFQYAEDNTDLKDLGNNTLVIVGEGTPIVGTEYECPHYISKKGNIAKILTVTNDFTNQGKGYSPAAKAKRDVPRRRRGEARL